MIAYFDRDVDGHLFSCASDRGKRVMGISPNWLDVERLSWRGQADYAK
jgi:hypothetical protein